MRSATAGIDGSTLVVVHQRQRAVAAVRRPRRVGRPSRARQGDDVGGRRPHAGDLLVAGNGQAGRGDGHGVGRWICSHRGKLAGADGAGRPGDRRRRPPGAAHRDGPEPATALFYYWDSELRAVRKGRYKAHFITSGAYGDGKPRSTPAAPVRPRRDPGERQDIAAAHPEIVADLVREAEAHRRAMTMGPPLFDGDLAPVETPR